MKSSEKLLFGLLTGAAIGAVLGILYAPDKGSETRKKVSKSGGEVLDSIKEKYQELGEVIAEKYNTVKKEAKGVVENGKEAITKLKDEVKHKLS